MKRIIKMQFRRKREGKTDYKKRLRLVSSRMPRLVVRTSLKNVSVQVIEYDPDGDKVITSAHSRELAKLGWKGYSRNLPACYLVGLLCGIRANKKVKKAILDTGLKRVAHGNAIYSAMKGFIDAGVAVPHDNAVLPPPDRIEGKHTKTVDAKMFADVKGKIMKVAQ
ncbi:50S ribosomal protein L18 [Candidatus Woesearchaeota archaeon]|nr:50S ribosomal protein L18 [Candidatus Woesearchaeota archaeon]